MQMYQIILSFREGMLLNATFNHISAKLYIVVVSFIGGGNWRKPPTYRRTLTNFKFYF
jgi:hypothetical protein